MTGVNFDPFIFYNYYYEGGDTYQENKGEIGMKVDLTNLYYIESAETFAKRNFLKGFKWGVFALLAMQNLGVLLWRKYMVRNSTLESVKKDDIINDEVGND